MGGFDNISKRGHVIAAAVLATCLAATSALAETPALERANTQPHHAVSTSPNPPAALAFLDGTAPNFSPVSSAPNLPPLTRAATRLRIEEMSPVQWLAQYGNVSIGQRE